MSELDHVTTVAGLDPAVARYVYQAWSAGTRRAYLGQWRAVQGWCARTGVHPLPLDPADLAAHLAAAADELRADGGHRYAPATLTKRVAAVNAVHRAAGHLPPGDHQLVRATLSGIRRDRQVPPRRMRAMELDDLRTVIAAMDTRTWPAGVAARRDHALLLLGWVTAMRRENLVSLRPRDLDLHPARGLSVQLRSSKTDQEGAGDTVAAPYGTQVSTCTPCAVLRWLALVAADNRVARMRLVLRATEGHVCDQPGDLLGLAGPVLRPVDRHGHIADRALSGAAVHDVVRRRRRAAGLDDTRYGAHSLRAGFVTTADAAGADSVTIARQTLHRDTRSVLAYVRHANPLSRNAVTRVGL